MYWGGGIRTLLESEPNEIACQSVNSVPYGAERKDGIDIISPWTPKPAYRRALLPLPGHGRQRCRWLDRGYRPLAAARMQELCWAAAVKNDDIDAKSIVAAAKTVVRVREPGAALLSAHRDN